MAYSCKWVGRVVVSFCFGEGETIIDRYCFGIVVFLLPIVNLLVSIYNEKFLIVEDVGLFFNQVAMLSFAAIAEEMFFRGLLQNELLLFLKKSKLFVIVWLNILFGILHILNVFSNSGVLYVAIQGLCAFGVGVALSAVYCRIKKLIVCVMIHILINITSIFMMYNQATRVLNKFEITVYIFVAIIYFFVGVKRMEEEKLKEGTDEFIY